ncbi:MAG: penicillin acylase family protein [Chloroflexota bacterium]
MKFRRHLLWDASIKPLLVAMSRKRLPQVDGRLYLAGLQRPVTIHRDRWGIPHVQAAGRHDLFFAQGFVHAQERLWQMELNRRAAAGRLAEVVGEVALETDRLARTLGFTRLAQTAWQATSERVKADVEAYTAGVNAFLDGRPRLPVEFRLLGYRPEAWQPLDTVAFGRLQTWALSHGWGTELTRAQLIEKLGAERAAELEPHFSDRQAITLPQGIEFNWLRPDGMLKAATGPFLGKGVFEGAGRGSNGWVIGPGRSATGHAILCNDPHLPLTNPAIWFYVHLQSDDGYHVTGVSLPGSPYVLIGHNEHVAWGATLTFIDCEDLFVERFSGDLGIRGFREIHPHPQPLSLARRGETETVPQSPNPRETLFYQFGEEWRPAEVIEERIKVRGKADHVEQVVLTHHGPLISPILPTNGQALTMASMALRPYESFDGFAALNEARNWDEFVAAVAHIESPALNLVYADIEDNVGYYVSGRVPVRAKGDGLTPAPGWSGEYEWIGEVPFTEMPHALNPKCGYLVTANNQIVGEDYPHYLGRLWRNGYRARRLDDLLSGQEQISLDDCQRFQFDFYSIPGRALVALLSEMDFHRRDAEGAKRTKSKTPRSLRLRGEQKAEAALTLELLQQWDGALAADSVGGAVYQVLLARLSYALLEPALGRELMLQFLGTGTHPLLHPITEFYGHWTVTLLRWLASGREELLGRPVDRQTLLVNCLAETAAELRQLLGNDPRQWQWGRLHQVRFTHALGVRPPLDFIFNQGPLPIGGDTDTVNQTGTLPHKPYENNAFAVSYRQVIDLGRLDNSRAMFAPGQSGHLASPHYSDLIQPWLTGGYFSMTWSREAVTAASCSQLTLAPQLGTAGSQTPSPPSPRPPRARGAALPSPSEGEG